MSEIIENIIATVVGGLLITIILFLLNEYCFPKKNLTGEWYTSVKTENTSHEQFENLIVVYKIHLLQKGYDLSGSGEKIKDILPDGSETVFLREKRVIIVVEGYFERKYFRKSIVYLNIEEKGRKRETRATYFLSVFDKNILKGKFISTAADSSGQIEMIKS